MGHLLDMISAYKLFQASPEPVSFQVSTKISWVIEKWNSLDSSLHTLSLLRNLGFYGFENIKIAFCSLNDSLKSLTFVSVSLPRHDLPSF